MRKQILTVIMIFTASVVFAQYPLAKGQTEINLGLGFSSGSIPVYLGFDYGVHPDISLGAEVSYHSYDEDWSNHNYHHSVLGISGNANYHFNTVLNIPSNWDLYAGINIGFYNWNSPDDYGGSHNSGLGIGAQIGARYFFSNKLGVNLEFGGGNEFTQGKIGLTIKL